MKIDKDETSKMKNDEAFPGFWNALKDANFELYVPYRSGKGALEICDNTKYPTIYYNPVAKDDKGFYVIPTNDPDNKPIRIKNNKVNTVFMYVSLLTERKYSINFLWLFISTSNLDFD